MPPPARAFRFRREGACARRLGRENKGDDSAVQRLCGRHRCRHHCRHGIGHAPGQQAGDPPSRRRRPRRPSCAALRLFGGHPLHPAGMARADRRRPVRCRSTCRLLCPSFPQRRFCARHGRRGRRVREAGLLAFGGIGSPARSREREAERFRPGAAGGNCGRAGRAQSAPDVSDGAQARSFGRRRQARRHRRRGSRCAGARLLVEGAARRRAGAPRADTRAAPDPRGGRPPFRAAPCGRDDTGLPGVREHSGTAGGADCSARRMWRLRGADTRGTAGRPGAPAGAIAFSVRAGCAGACACAGHSRCAACSGHVRCALRAGCADCLRCIG